MENPKFLPKHVVLPSGQVAKRRYQEPWLFEVQAHRDGVFTRLAEIPGVAYDGYRRTWLIPEEVLVLEVLQ
jgi:hypothetical protein